MLLVQSAYTKTAYVLTGDIMIVIRHYGKNTYAYIYDIVMHANKRVLFNLQDFMGECTMRADMITQIQTLTSSINFALHQSIAASHPTMFDNGERHVGHYPLEHYAGLYDLVSQVLSHAY